MKKKARNKIYAVILAGGAGERFWPLSRIKNPKYAIRFGGNKSLIEETVGRLKGIVQPDNIIIVTNKEQEAVIKKHLKGLEAKQFLLEPYSRNTAAAIAFAAVYLRRKNPDSLMIVLPADHVIRNIKAFGSSIKQAINVAERGYLVTLGIKPTSPHTGYGYIKAKDKKLKAGSRVFYYEMDKFVEKPDRKTAEKFLKDKKFYWNSGIFVWKTDEILRSLESHIPKLYKSVCAIENLLGMPEEKKRISKIYEGLEKISIDCGVMEKSRNRAIIPARFDWNDLGCWLSLEDMYRRDKDRNISEGTSVMYDTKDSITFSPGDYLIATCGVRNLVVVHTKDATLIAAKDKTQEIKKLLEFIRKKKLAKHL